MLDRRLEGRDRAAANLESLKAAVDFAKDQLGYTYLKAPWAGTVVATYVENFEDVRAKQQIFRLLDTSRIEFVIDVPEKMISYALNVTKIAIRFAPFPGRDFPAEIKEIASEATEGSRTYPVTLIMDQQKDVKILPGMAGEALVEGSVPDRFGKEGIEVPPSAVFSPEDNQKTFVWVIDENTMTVGKREVQTGAMTMSGTIIREGVTPGEWVVTAGVHYLREGQEVKILSGSAWEGSQ
jgi:RND family efflux transporter MFP subunit